MSAGANAGAEGRSGDGADRNWSGAQWLEPHPGCVCIRLAKHLVDDMKADLRRPHPFAAERVGFLSVATGRGEGGELLVLGVEYRPVEEEHYV